MANEDWVALCGEVHPDSKKRCIKKKQHEGFHSSGDGHGWMPWDGWDWLCEMYEQRAIPATWGFNVTPLLYDEEVLGYDLGPQATQIIDFLNGYP